MQTVPLIAQLMIKENTRYSYAKWIYVIQFGIEVTLECAKIYDYITTYLVS